MVAVVQSEARPMAVDELRSHWQGAPRVCKVCRVRGPRNQPLARAVAVAPPPSPLKCPCGSDGNRQQPVLTVKPSLASLSLSLVVATKMRWIGIEIFLCLSPQAKFSRSPRCPSFAHMTRMAIGEGLPDLCTAWANVIGRTAQRNPGISTNPTPRGARRADIVQNV